VVGHQAPGVNAKACVSDDGGESVDEILTIDIGAKDHTPFDPASDNVVEGQRIVEPRSTGHVASVCL
jgi:hypothetical protein